MTPHDHDTFAPHPALAALRPPARDFGSDNRAPACPAALAALAAAGDEPRADSYGDDPVTARAGDLVRLLFDPVPPGTGVLWVPTGTAANMVAVGACRPGPGSSVLAAADAHVRVDEAGALERAWGTPVVPVECPQGLMEPAALSEAFDAAAVNAPFSPVPEVVVVTQATESGRVHSLDTVAELVDVAARRGARVVVDGARFANALAARPEMSALLATGVAAVVVGGTKNGAPFAEAVVCPSADTFALARRAAKQLGHTVSKSRYLAAGAAGCLAAGCFLDHACAANAKAARLGDALVAAGVELWRPVEANLVFARLGSDGTVAALDAWSHVSHWGPRGLVRLACAFDHTDDDVAALTAGVRALLV